MSIIDTLLAPYRGDFTNDPLSASLMDMAAQQGQGPKPADPNAPGALSDTYVGGTGTFNETHEGPGTDGLSMGTDYPQYHQLAQKLYNLLERKFPEVSFGGIFNNRNIAGTSTPSEHAYGAALDTMVGSNQLGDQVYRFLNRDRIADRFDYSNILWEVPDHYNHLHVGWLY